MDVRNVEHSKRKKGSNTAALFTAVTVFIRLRISHDRISQTTGKMLHINTEEYGRSMFFIKKINVTGNGGRTEALN